MVNGLELVRVIVLDLSTAQFSLWNTYGHRKYKYNMV